MPPQAGCGVFGNEQGRRIEICDVHESTDHSKTTRLKKITTYWIPEPI
jgi:hypothetical protein